MEAKKLSQPQVPPFELSLRIRHPSIDPAEVSDELRLEARHSFKAGDPREPRSGGKSSLHAESYWLGALDAIPMPNALLAALDDVPQVVPAAAREKLMSAMTRDLDMALSWCIRYLSRTHAPFIHRIQAEGGEVRLLVTISSPPAALGFTLTPEVARMVNDLAIAVNFEFATSD